MNETSNLQGSDRQSKLSPAKRHIKAFRATNDYVAKLIKGPVEIKEDRFAINQLRPGQLPDGFLIVGSWYEHTRAGFFFVVEHSSFPAHDPEQPIPLIELEACDIDVERVTPESEELDRLTCESAKTAIAENEDFRKCIQKLEQDKANLQGWAQRALEQIEGCDGIEPVNIAAKMLRSALRGDDILGVVMSGPVRMIEGEANPAFVIPGRPYVMPMIVITHDIPEKSIRERLAEIVKEEADEVSPKDWEIIYIGCRFSEDMSMDRIAKLNLVLAIEKEFGITISDAEAVDAQTFGGLLVLVTAKLDALP